jgi:hypothetical protein
VVRCDPLISAEQAAEFKAMIVGRLPDIDVVLIAADQLLVYRPGEVTS